jgi:hypothetical protein
MRADGWLLGSPLARAAARPAATEAVAVDQAAGEATGEMGHIRRRRVVAWRRAHRRIKAPARRIWHRRGEPSSKAVDPRVAGRPRWGTQGGCTLASLSGNAAPLTGDGCSHDMRPRSRPHPGLV